ncbi:hypothetical protein ACFLZZ_01130 [Nanoarchaeota archaeon]
MKKSIMEFLKWLTKDPLRLILLPVLYVFFDIYGIIGWLIIIYLGYSFKDIKFFSKKPKKKAKKKV